MNPSGYRITSSRFTAAIALLLVSYYFSTNPIHNAHSFQLTPRSRAHNTIRHRVDNNTPISSRTTTQCTILQSTAAASTSESRDDSSFASQWMENEKRIEDQMDQKRSNNNSIASATNDGNVYDETNVPFGKWEYIDGNYILRPSFEDINQQPRALLHFLGGAFLRGAPQLTYRYLLERLASRGYLIVTTPYQLSFDHLRTCDEIIDKFERGEIINGVYSYVTFLYIILLRSYSSMRNRNII